MAEVNLARVHFEGQCSMAQPIQSGLMVQSSSPVLHASVVVFGNSEWMQAAILQLIDTI